MKLYIDTREPVEIKLNLRNLLKSIEIEIEESSLDIGDFIIENENIKLIFQRKSLSDLECSIKDGRYKEQSFRLNSCNVHNHNIYYIIEGNISTYKNAYFKNTIYSSIVSLSLFKGFSIIKSLSMNETCNIIYSFINKINREKINKNINGFYKNNKDLKEKEKENEKEKEKENENEDLKEKEKENENENEEKEDLKEKEVPNNSYLNVIKVSKKENVTKNNINEIMLMQIPYISIESSRSIINKYKTIDNLISCLRENKEDLNDLKLLNSNRKINKRIIQNILNYLL